MSEHDGDTEATTMLRQGILALIDKYPDLTVYVIIGCLEAIKLDLFDAASESHEKTKRRT